MKDFFLHIDKDVRDIGEIEVLNQDVMPYDSSSDEGGSKNIKKKQKAIRRAKENSESRVGDLFYMYQTFVSFEDLRYMIKNMQQRQEVKLF